MAPLRTITAPNGPPLLERMQFQREVDGALHIFIGHTGLAVDNAC